MRYSRWFHVLLSVTAMTVFSAGCEYEGPTAMYYQDHAQTLAPQISQIEPDGEAGAGVNYITIKGANFSETAENTQVYFNSYSAEIVDNSATAITVRRPNITSDSVVVKVVTDGALEIARYGPYRITPVYSAYGDFITGNRLSTMMADDQGNVFVFQSSPRTVFKINPDGTRITLPNETSRAVTDARIAPDGKLILMMNNRRIYQMDMQSGEESEWFDVTKSVASGDFDGNGNFYAGGRRSDLNVIAAGLAGKRALGQYSSDEIVWVRVHLDHVYILLAPRTPTPENPAMAIWRHPILDSSGNLGSGELMLDWEETEVALYSPTSFTISGDGTLYVGVEVEDESAATLSPILILNSDGSHDLLYKGILPSYAAKVSWAAGDYLYMLLGGDDWDLIRIEI